MNSGFFLGQVLPPEVLGITIFVVAALVLIIVLSGIRVVKEWERAVVTRRGRFLGLKGPGIFWILPGIDKILKIITLPRNCPECGYSLDHSSFPAINSRIEIGCPSGHLHIFNYEIQNGQIRIERI
jgi:hypothetical protein